VATGTSTPVISLGTVPITKGGTGATTAIYALNALLPNQFGNDGKFLYTNGAWTSWVSPGNTCFINGGNAFVMTATIGTTDAYGLNFKTNNVNRITIGSTGSVALPAFTTAGVVHNDATTGVLSSSLIVNNDIDAAAGIADTKLATISTDGKVSNSATTATSANTSSAIVSRDLSGNFSAGTITADLTGNATTVTGTVAIANGGTGATTAPTAINALLPAQTGNTGKYLTTNGSAASWAAAATGTVTTVTGTAPISVATGTTTPAISISAASTSAAGSMSAADKTKLDGISGTNTGDETNATIKTKLGISTLSGSNTGDQTLSGLGGVAGNAAITGATNTKITYDSKGLVTAGAAATTADIAPSTNKNYVTDAQAIVIGNTSGTNTGDQTNVTGSAASFTGSLAGDVTGTQGATVVGKINGTSMAGLATGILKNTTTTGVPSIAVAADFPTLNQNTTGTAANVTGTVAIANGGTGATTAPNAINALLPTQTGNNGKYLTTNGSAASWAAVTTGTVTNVTGTAPISVTSGTTTPAIAISAATTSAAGSMSAADKAKLDGSTHYLGEHYGGGIVFYVYDGGRHGLIAWHVDIIAPRPWKYYWDRVIGATGDGVNAGAMNTALIVAATLADDQSASNFAAREAADCFSTDEYGVTSGDWIF
jgi:hypothetical protein